MWRELLPFACGSCGHRESAMFYTDVADPFFTDSMMQHNIRQERGMVERLCAKCGHRGFSRVPSEGPSPRS